MGSEIHEFRQDRRKGPSNRPLGISRRNQVLKFGEKQSPAAKIWAAPDLAEDSLAPPARGFGVLLATGFAFVFVAAFIFMPTDWFDAPPASARGEMQLAASPADTLSGRFGFCHEGGGYNCVVDGDTFWFEGSKIRIADIDTPETHPSRCAYEARTGKAATQALHALLNQGAFSLENIDRDRDRFGRKLRIVTRGGKSLGGVLVDQGLARWYGTGRRSWC